MKLRNPQAIRALGLLALAPILTGCQAISLPKLPVPRGLLERSVDNASLTSQDLRTLLNDSAVRMASQVESTSDAMMTATDSAEIRRHALLWKMNGVSSTFQAASRPDALAAFLDTWILVRQWQAVASSDQGRQWFGNQQPTLVASIAELDRDLKKIDAKIGANLTLVIGDEHERIEQFVDRFAREFPIRSLSMHRESIAVHYIEKVARPNREVLDVMGTLEENVTELRKLMATYADYVPKQSRWQAELLLMDTLGDSRLTPTLQDFDEVAAAAASLANTAAELPLLVRGERLAVQEFVADQQAVAFAEIAAMRSTTAAELQHERQVLIDEFRRERRAIEAFASQERSVVTAEFREEVREDLRTALEATDTISSRRVTDVAAQSRQLVDRFVWRLGQLFALLVLALAAVVIASLRFHWRQRLTIAVPSHDETSWRRAA